MDDPEDVVAIVRCTYRTPYNTDEAVSSDMGQWLSLKENVVAPQESTGDQETDTEVGREPQSYDIFQVDYERSQELDKDNTSRDTIVDDKFSINTIDANDQKTRVTVGATEEKLDGGKGKAEEPLYRRVLGYLWSLLPSSSAGSQSPTNNDNNEEFYVELCHVMREQEGRNDDLYQQESLYTSSIRYENECRTDGFVGDVDRNQFYELENENKRLLEEKEKLTQQSEDRDHANKLRCEQLKCELHYQRDELNTFAKKNQNLKTEVSLLHNQLARIEQELQTVKLEKEDAQKRLSELMSARLRDNNPNIVDLSDQFRPNKLGEMMNELYDNQWTSLFTYIEDGWDAEDEFPERDCIQMLLDIVMEAYTFCSLKMTKDTINTIRQLFGQEINDLDPELIKMIKDKRKNSALCTLVQVQKNCIPTLKSLIHTNPISEKARDSNEVFEYMHECIKLCWLMVLQDPPVYLVCEGWLSKTKTGNDEDYGDGNGEQGPEISEFKREIDTGHVGTPGLHEANETSTIKEEGRACGTENIHLVDGIEMELRIANDANTVPSILDEQRGIDNPMPISEDGLGSQKRKDTDNNQAKTNDSNTDISGEQDKYQKTQFNNYVDHNKYEHETVDITITKSGDVELNHDKMKTTEQKITVKKTNQTKCSTPAADESETKVPFSKDFYKEYTRRGPYIDYIVWPVMYLHKDGPLLNKGVAQGCK